MVTMLLLLSLISPIIGWVVAGLVAMFCGNQGAEIGGGTAEDLNKNC